MVNSSGFPVVCSIWRMLGVELHMGHDVSAADIKRTWHMNAICSL